MFLQLNDSAIKLIKSYLTNRNRFVKIESKESTLKSISLGVPQGSVSEVVVVNKGELRTTDFHIKESREKA